MTKPMHRANSTQAKRGLNWRFWRWSRFFPAVLSRSSNPTPSSAPREEIAPNTQMHRFGRLGGAQKGFTLVEILVISPVLMITIVYMMSYLFGQYGQLVQQGSQLNLQAEAQNAVYSMQDDIFFADAFSTGVNSGLTDAYQPNSGWSNNTTPPTLIISTPALTASHRDSNRQPVYINTQGCSPQDVLESNDALYNNVIYFVSGTTLYKRIISAPASMNTCGTSYLKQSCPPANATSSCPSDRILSDKVSSFAVTYYDTNNNVVTDPGLAEKVKVDLQLKDKAFAEDIYTSSSLTMRKLNL